MDLDLLHRFFANQTSLQEEETIRIWLTSSPENEKQFIKERKLYDAIILNSDKSITEIFDAENKLEKIKAKKESIRPKEFFRIAAAIVITALSFWLYDSYVERNEAMALQTISVPAGQQINIILPDGTNVWLNAKTTIKYPVGFNRKERLVQLDGEAYFDVAKNKDIPFIVMTKKGSVEALGTKFNVMAYSDNEEFEAALMEGSVKVDLLQDPSQSLILSPNNKSFVENGKLQSMVVDDYSPYQWKEGLISFKNEPFIYIMKAFEKTYDVKISIEDTKLTQGLLYTGKFRIIDGVDYALRVLKKDLNFEYYWNKEENIIRIK